MTNASNVVVVVDNGVVNNEESTTAALTKVFVGGLAWETQKDSLRQHFEKYGEILEAVIIYDKLTGRSKGYGFVTFKEPEAAKFACEDPSPTINGRRANCNLAALGAKSTSRGPPSPFHKRSPSSTPTLPAQQQGLIAAAGNFNRVTPGGGKQPSPHQVQWFFYPGAPQAVPAVAPMPPAHYHHHNHHAAQHQPAVAPAPLPYYGYSPVMYVATDYSQKANYGGYMNAQPHHPVYAWQQSAAMVGQLPTTAATTPTAPAANGHHAYIPIMHPDQHHQGVHTPYYHHQYISPINYHHHTAAVASMGFPVPHRVISPSAAAGRIASV